jgi:phosphatidylglycerol:prolipoprotein diacylglycerol transferase
MENMTTVCFPGLGIGEVSFSRVAFTLFGRPVYWYGVIIMVGIIVAFAHALWRSKREGVTQDDLFDLAIFIVLFGVLGARLYYVATTWGNYHSFRDVIAIWDGGLAIYGGIIAGILTVLVVCRVKKLNVLKVTDMVAPGVMIAQAIGRWGNFCNGEAFGEVVPEGSLLYPFRMGLVSDFTGSVMQYYHPTFLYESVWNVLGFVLITLSYKHKKFNGQIFLSYLTWYGFGRMFIEGLRTDSLYVGQFRISQVVGLLCFLVGSALLIAGFVLQRKGKLSGTRYEVRWFQPARIGVTASDAETVDDRRGSDTVSEQDGAGEGSQDNGNSQDSQDSGDSQENQKKGKEDVSAEDTEGN